MSLITRCPACETMFKVVPDQLRISEGWVRCGQCSEIFNASQHLLGAHTPGAARAIAGVSPPDSPSGPAAVRTTEAPGLANTAPPAPPAPPDIPAYLAPPVAEALPEHPLQLEPVVPAAANTPTGRSAMDLARLPEEPHWSDESAMAPAGPAPAQRFVLPPGLLDDKLPLPMAPADPEPFGAAAARDTDVSFLRPEAAPRSFWRLRSVRIVLFLLAILLGAVLVAQVLVHERNRIAQLEPATRPALTALCALVRCELGPLQQIESIVIDSSSFGRLRADNYRLAFSLRNTAPVGVAMPAIELSLTDAQDQALVRRVLLPVEFGAPGGSMAPDSDWSGTLTLNVRAATTTDRVAGYRLLAFYP